MSKDVCILIREKGHAIPASVLTPIIERYSRYVGIARVEGDSVQLVRLPTSDKWQMTLEAIQGNDVKLKNQTVVWVFGSGDETINNADMQPFGVITDEKNHTLVGLVADGEFDGDPRKVIEEKVFPRIKRAFRAAQGDVAKFMMEEMTDPQIGEDMLNEMLGERGSFVVIGSNGDVLKYETPKDKTCKAFDWGWLSNITGILEPEVKEDADPLAAAIGGATTETKPAASSSGLRKPGSSATATAAPASNTPAGGGLRKPAGSSSGTNPPVSDQSTLIKKDGVTEEEMVEVRVPKDAQSSTKSKGNFLRKRYPDELPEDWFKKVNSFKVPVSWVMAGETPQARLIKEELDAGKPHVSRVKVKTVRALEDLGDAVGHKQSAENGTAATTKPQNASGASGLRRPGAQASASPQPDTRPVDPGKAPQPDIGPPSKKDVTVHHIGKSNKGILAGYNGIAPPAQVAEMQAYLNEKAVDRNSGKIGHPAGYHEPDVPSFIKQLNHPQYKELAHTFNWEPEILRDMTKNASDLAVAYMMTLRGELIRVQQEYRNLRDKTSGEDAVDTSGTGVMKQEPEKKVATGGLRRPGR